MNLYIRFLLILLLIFGFSFAYSQSEMELALKLLQNKQYDQAINKYQSINNKGFESVDLYNNLALCYFKISQLPKSVLYYERALKLDPGNKLIKSNLLEINKKLDSDIVEIRESSIIQWLNSFVRLFNAGSWLIFLILSMLLLLLLVIFRIYKFNWISLSYINLFTFLVILIFIINLITFRFSYKNSFETNNAILMNSKPLYKSPDISSPEIYKLNAGEKLKIIDGFDHWYQVMLVNKETGWIDRNDIEKI